MSLPLTSDFHSIVLNETPLLDVRAPVEFEKGAFTNASNFPILIDKERHLIGIKYKNEGNEAAVKLAEKLIKETGKEERVANWKKYLKENKNALLYCFRGGQRSGIAQEWLGEAGVEITRLEGGYKAFRSYLMEQTLEISKKTDILILGGRTGSGKTLLLPEIENSIDLENIANHRGSSFGNFITSQPTQINFENTLAYKLIQFESKNYKNLVIEHESHNIGRSFIPKSIYKNFMDGKLILLETPLEERIKITFDEYIVGALKNYNKKFGDEGINKWAKDVNNNLDKIQKRLGSQVHSEFKFIFHKALKEHLENGNIEGYKELLKRLLVDYYDPMYDYQIQKSPIPIVFKGNAKEVLAFIK
ncbi:MAG: tRNA 2-selenouridine(34) synthase MnmH, partial [Sulfurimonas sp.]